MRLQGEASPGAERVLEDRIHVRGPSEPIFGLAPAAASPGYADRLRLTLGARFEKSELEAPHSAVCPSGLRVKDGKITGMVENVLGKVTGVTIPNRP